MPIASWPDGLRHMPALVATVLALLAATAFTAVMLVFGAAPIHAGSAASSQDASAIAALDAIPAEDWLKQSSGALLDRVIAASSKESLDAAAAKDPRAQALVGSALHSGVHGYVKSEAEATKFYRLAADSNPIAQNNLGNLLLSGVANGGTPAPAEAAEMFRRAAKLGHPVAQANLGRLYADGVGVEKDVAKAKEYLTLAAAQGNSDAKDFLDVLKAREAAEKWKRLEAAAATGDADALNELAEAYEELAKEVIEAIKTNQFQLAVNTILKAPDREKVRIAELADENGMTALHWAVTNRNAAAMRWLLDKKAHLELKDDQGRTPLKIALDNQDVRAMTMLIDRGAMTSTVLPGHDEELKALKTTSDIVDFMIWTNAPAAAAAVYQKTCSSEEPITCLKLGLRYNEGNGVPKDPAKAAALFKIACDANNAEACGSLAILSMKGEGVPLDDAKAAALAQKACTGGYASSCTGVGFRHLFGDGLPKDLQKAASLFEKACAGNESHGCYTLGLMHETNQGGTMDPAKAATFYARGCELGNQESCKRQTATVAASTKPAKTPAAAGNASATPAKISAAVPAAASPANAACKIARVQPGVDTVASVERDIQARGGAPSTGGSGLSKYRMSALSGDYQDAGTDVMAVNYDFDAAGPAGRLVAVTIVNHANTGPGYEKLLAARKAAATAIAGPLQQKSATELVASVPGCQLRFLPNADTWFIHEVYQLPN